jgi:hypothetical protein
MTMAELAARSHASVAHSQRRATLLYARAGEMQRATRALRIAERSEHYVRILEGERCDCATCSMQRSGAS